MNHNSKRRRIRGFPYSVTAAKYNGCQTNHDKNRRIRRFPYSVTAAKYNGCQTKFDLITTRTEEYEGFVYSVTQQSTTDVKQVTTRTEEYEDSYTPSRSKVQRMSNKSRQEQKNTRVPILGHCSKVQRMSNKSRCRTSHDKNRTIRGFLYSVTAIKAQRKEGGGGGVAKGSLGYTTQLGRRIKMVFLARMTRWR